MKWLIASDIHGSAYWCEKLIHAWHNEQADRMLLLGDILYHGPRNELPKEYNPKDTIRMLSELDGSILCVRGNCDAEVDQMVLPFPILSEHAFIPVGNHLMFVTHGHKYNSSNLPPLHYGDILLHGHTHIPECVQSSQGIWIINPGSVSIPKANSWNGYVLYENQSFIWKDFDGNTRNHWISE